MADLNLWKKLSKNINILTIFVSLIVFAVIYSFTNLFYSLDKSIMDYHYRSSSSVDKKVSKDIIVVGIDTKTLKELGRFPFERRKYIPVIENLKNAGALVIGFDIIFADKTNEEVDLKFAEAVKKAGNVILGFSRSSDGSLEKPYKELLEGVKYIGYFVPVVNERNQTVYSISPSNTFGKEVFSHFSIAVLRKYYEEISLKDYSKYVNKYDRNFYYITDSEKIPLAETNTNIVNINFVPNNKITRMSFLDIYKGNFDPKQVKDKILIIGATEPGIKDIFFTPNGQEYGVYTHANMINTILTQEFKINFNKNLELFLIFFLIVLSVYFNISRTGKSLIYANISVIIIFLGIIVFIVDFLKLSLNYPSEIIFSLIISLTVSNILKYLIESESKGKLSKALSEYVSTQVANEILSGDGKVSLDGEKKEISIFFSDIAGFTTISEKFEPEDLVKFLREYLSEMSNIIMDEKGFINKYEGDAIMALWGVFGHSESASFDNCESALKQQETLKNLNVLWKERFGEELKVRMGLHTGSAIIGNIGAEGKKMEFTALGDSVNLSSRLEGVNKFYGTYICASESIFEREKENFEFRYLDKIRVKGKNNAVGIYELICRKGEISQEQALIRESFETAMEYYFGKNFEKALEIFENIGDGPSLTYKERCQDYIKNPPDSSWDGVWEMKSK